MMQHFAILGFTLLFSSMASFDDPVVEPLVDEAAAEQEDPEEGDGEEGDSEVVEEPKARSTWEYLAEKYDADEDGQITPEEYGRDETHFKRLDVDSDGVISKAEIDERDRASRGGRGGGGRGGRGGRGRRGEGEARPARGVAPLEGSEAPDFELLVLAERKASKREAEAGEDEEGEAPEDKKEQGTSEEEGGVKEEAEKKLKLSSFQEKKRPVALIFGSYT